MTCYEGILVSRNSVVNAAAIGAKIEVPRIEFGVYMPSDTARNLDREVRFTYSLTKDPSLFFKAALTGHDDPKINEINKRELIVDGDFIYPKNAGKVYFCEVEETSKKTVQDKYGSSEIKEVKGKILEARGEEKRYLDRGDPLVDALVHASRICVADESQKRQLYSKIKSRLKDSESTFKEKIIDFSEEHLDEV